MSNWTVYIRFVLALITVFAILVKPYIPRKTLLLHPATAQTRLYAQKDESGNPMARWVDESSFEWRCEYPDYRIQANCSFGVNFDITSQDLSKTQTPSGHPPCSSRDADPDGDGWGWENNQSCEIVPELLEDSGQENKFPLCGDPKSDPDGDGWGWENDHGCKVETARIHEQVIVADEQREIPAGQESEPVKQESSDAVNYPLCKNTESDPDGDGWGWENGKSCEVPPELLGKQLQKNSEEDAEVESSSNFPKCTDPESDPDGDGWGWENGKSCEMPAELIHQELAATVEVEAEPTPPHADCKDPGSDPDGDGWGWEDDHSCRVVWPEEVQVEEEIEEFIELEGPRYEIGKSKPRFVDASGYEGIEVKIHYEGRSDYLRISLHNRNPNYEGVVDKFMSTLLRTEDLRGGTAFVSLSQFSVAQWWTLKENPTRAMATPEFGNLTSISIDVVEYGIHRLRIEEIKLVGERIKNKTYLATILLLWVGYLILEGGYRYYRLKMSSLAHKQQIEHLSGRAEQLEAKKEELKSRSVKDVLTGIYNRYGFSERISERAGEENNFEGKGLMILDIDHFKSLNDTFGHDIGDLVLAKFAELVSEIVRENDVFARWGGEEFVLFVENCGNECMMNYAERLRSIVEQERFSVEHGLHITISIGVALGSAGDSFEEVFKRADNALYRAKVTRNTVAYDA